jgi:hypothetical protein
MCRGTTLGGTAINIHVYVRGSDEYHYVTEYNADHVKFNDDDGAEYVLVRRVDYDNLAAAVYNLSNPNFYLAIYDHAFDLVDHHHHDVDHDDPAALVQYVHDDIPDLDHLNNRPVYIDIDDAAGD